MGIVKEILEFFLSPLRDELYLKRKMKKEEKRILYKKVLERIKKEYPNFSHINTGKPYKSDLHKKAVEQYSFELLKEDLIALEKIQKLRKLTNTIIQEIDNNEVQAIIELLDKLKIGLEKKIK